MTNGAPSAMMRRYAAVSSTVAPVAPRNAASGRMPARTSAVVATPSSSDSARPVAASAVFAFPSMSELARYAFLAPSFAKYGNVSGHTQPANTTIRK